MRAYVLTLALALVGCGEDAPSGAPPPPAPAPARPAGGRPAGKPGKPLKPMVRVEDRVTCPTPSDAKKCEVNAPICPQGQYCIPAGTAAYCGACPERDAIRHVFKPRDFQGADFRDPFHSFVIAQPGLGSPTSEDPKVVTQKCSRKDQFVASTYSFQQLRLVGIVSQGTQRKVLMMGGNLGYIIKKGDCVGKEKAVVKDIGAGFVTFSVESATKTEAAEYSMQLYPTQVSMTTPDAIDPGAASTPMVAPPTSGGVAPPAPTGQAQPGTTTTTTVIQTKPPEPTRIEPPAQAPTNIKP